MIENKVQHILERYLRFAHRRPAIVISIVLAVTILSIFVASKLELRSSLKELLPNKYTSVQELNRLMERVGGVGNLIVAIESPDLDANKRFVEDLAKKLNELPKGTFRYIDYKSDDIRDYYEKYFLYYLPIDELNSLYESIERRIEYEKVKNIPFFIDFEEKDPLEAEIEDIKERNQKNFQAPLYTIDSYYGGEWGHLLIMLIRPYGASLSVENARTLVKTVEDTANSLDPVSYNPYMKISFCGDVKSTIEEYDTMLKDISSTAILCILLIALVIFLFFLKIRTVFLLSSTLVIAIVWTFALTKVAIGYLNAQTAFLSSIIAGTGINYGIIIIGRYLEERMKQRESLESMVISIKNTLGPTFLAFLTTAVAFLVLLTAKIKGLSQFGFIGAVGVSLCWVTSIIVLPVTIFISERLYPVKYHKQTSVRRSILFPVLFQWINRSYSKIFLYSVAVTVFAFIVVVNFIPNSIEYDFTKLRSRISVSSGTEALEKRVTHLIKHSMTPSVVLVDRMEDADLVCKAVMEKNASLPDNQRMVESCHSIYSLLPKEQEEKLAILEKYRNLLNDNEKWYDKLDYKLKQKIDRIRDSLRGKELTLADLPDELTRHFRDLQGNLGVLAFISPRSGMNLADGRNLINFANIIKDIKLQDGRVFHAASAAMIFSDLVTSIKKDAPVITVVSFIAVLLFVWATVRRFKISSYIIWALVSGVLVMVSIMALFGIKLNFFNFIVLPLTFGIAVDYGINVAMRLMKEDKETHQHAYISTGGAVLLCSLTTIVGFAILMIANNQALVSFGKMAIIGEISCITMALIVVPALMIRMTKRQRDKWKK